MLCGFNHTCGRVVLILLLLIAVMQVFDLKMNSGNDIGLMGSPPESLLTHTGSEGDPGFDGWPKCWSSGNRISCKNEDGSRILYHCGGVVKSPGAGVSTSNDGSCDLKGACEMAETNALTDQYCPSQCPVFKSKGSEYRAICIELPESRGWTSCFWDNYYTCEEETNSSAS